MNEPSSIYEKIFYALAVGLVWLSREMWSYIKNIKTKDVNHKTFADDADRYWRQMKEVVTQPLSEVLKTTNDILKELRDRAIKEDAVEQERRKRRV